MLDLDLKPSDKMSLCFTPLLMVGIFLVLFVLFMATECYKVLYQLTSSHWESEHIFDSFFFKQFSYLSS